MHESVMEANALSKSLLQSSMSLTMRRNPETPTSVLTFAPSKMPDTLILNSKLISFDVYFNVAMMFEISAREPPRGRWVNLNPMQI